MASPTYIDATATAATAEKLPLLGATRPTSAHTVSTDQLNLAGSIVRLKTDATDAATPYPLASLGWYLRACPAPPAAGAVLEIWLPGGRTLLFCAPPGASAQTVVRRAAAACGLAPSQLALFCGGRRLLGPAPLGQAGGVRKGGTLRVVQRLLGGGPELTPEATLTAAFQKFVGADSRITKEGFVAALTHQGGGRAITREEAEARFGRFDVGDDGAVLREAIVKAWTALAPPPAPEAEGVPALGLTRVTAEQAEGALLAAEQAAEETAAMVTAEQAAGARLASEQVAAEAAAVVTAEEAGCLVAEQAATDEAAAALVAALPPHLPPARDVAVSEDTLTRWKKYGGTEIEAVLASGAVALLDAKWLIELSARGGVLRPRQALPDEAFLSLSELHASTEEDLPVVCVSHCWLQPDQPDPRGHNLRAVARALASLTKGGNRIGVFLDFCSIHQNCRDRDGAPQDTAFAWLEKEGRLADGAVGRLPTKSSSSRRSAASAPSTRTRTQRSSCAPPSRPTTMTPASTLALAT